jgi:UDP-galactose transporter B1
MNVVLLMGVFVFGKHQPLLKYICVFLVTIGISVCIFSSQKKLLMIYPDMWDEISHSSSSVETSAFGVFLLGASLAMDGITGPFQDQLVHTYQPSSECMMFSTNLWASIFLTVGTFDCCLAANM